jgi:signal peptidase II
MAVEAWGQPRLCAAIALIIGGAVGNLYDRVAIGRVVDFLLFHYHDWHYPAFNVADSAITVGAAALILESFRQRRDEPAARTLE